MFARRCEQKIAIMSVSKCSVLFQTYLCEEEEKDDLIIDPQMQLFTYTA